jgi:hypothetical protein
VGALYPNYVLRSEGSLALMDAAIPDLLVRDHVLGYIVSGVLDRGNGVGIKQEQSDRVPTVASKNLYKNALTGEEKLG